MNEIIILTPGPFLKRDYDRFGIELFKNNFSVQILDFTAWLNPIFWKKCSADVYNCQEYLIISCKEDFLKFYSKINSVIVIDYLIRNKKTNWARQLFKKKQSIFVRTDTNLQPPNPKIFLPYPVFGKSIIRKLKKIFKIIINPIKFFKKEYFQFIINKYDDLKLKYQPDILVLGGSVNSKKLNAKNKIYAHHMDYDVYLNIKDQPNKSTGSYAVFLDSDIMRNPDFALLNQDTIPMNEIQYYSLLTSFFKKFEKTTKLKIKFSSHPKSNKKIFSSLLKNTDYSCGNTAELVKNSKLVLLHQSTALSYAILFNKPAIFLTSNDLNNSIHGSSIYSFAKEIDGQIINLNSAFEKNLDLKKLLKIDELKYQNYKNNYLKFPNSPDIPIWEIFINYIKNKEYDK